MEPSLWRKYFCIIPFLLIKSYFAYEGEDRRDDAIHLIYIVKNCVAVTIGTYIGCNLCYYSDIARNELKKHYFEL